MTCLWNVCFWRDTVANIYVYSEEALSKASIYIFRTANSLDERILLDTYFTVWVKISAVINMQYTEQCPFSKCYCHLLSTIWFLILNNFNRNSRFFSHTWFSLSASKHLNVKVTATSFFVIFLFGTCEKILTKFFVEFADLAAD